MLKKYQFKKMKNYFRNYNIVIILNCSRVEFKHWLNSEQIIKHYKLKYYTVQNNRFLKLIKESIYKNFAQILSSTILLVQNQNIKEITLFLNHIKNIDNFLLPISIKINNKTHTPAQIKELDLFNFNQQLKHLNKKLIFFSRINKKIKPPINSK